MKINARIISASLIVVFLIAFIILFMGYRKQVDARNLANQNLAAAQTAFTKATADQTAANKQLEQANSQLTQLQDQLSQSVKNLSDVKTSLPTSINGIDYTDIIYDAARNFGVNVQYPLQKLSQDKPADSTAGNITFSTYPFSFSVTADNLTDIVNFIHALATQDAFKDSTIGTAAINYSTKTTTTDNPDGTKTEKTVTFWSTDISITIYAYNG